MNKLNKAFKINPLYEADGYKVGHHLMLAPNVTREAWNWIPRSLKYIHPAIKKILCGGPQISVRYVHGVFQEYFFDQPIESTERFARDMCKYLMMDYKAEHFYALHKLGYLPIEIKSLAEGTFTKANVPHITGINTVDGNAWLGLFLETLFSKTLWQATTAATIGFQYKRNAVEWVKKTDVDNLWLADFMAHDFHSRGGNPFTSIVVGLGHAMSNSGSDTLNVIPASRYYYDFDEEEVPVYSVNASEHSVSCTNIFYYKDALERGELDDEIAWYYSSDLPCDGDLSYPDYLAIAECLMLRDWLKKFPKGILSYVCDTFNTWKSCTHIIPRLKEEILARDGKLVVRGDSGDPVDIICGTNTNSKVIGEGEYVYPYYKDCSQSYKDSTSENEYKGMVELLWDIFGGVENNQGFKVLDSHIGTIYGDSITLERQLQIYERLALKGFAATNVILGIGSYTYVLITRDNLGWAIKGCWFEIGLQKLSDVARTPYNIYKDPITDDGTKKSLKGFTFVYLDENGEIEVEQEVSEEKYNSEENLLKTIYKDGEFFNQTTLTEIRERIAEVLK